MIVRDENWIQICKLDDNDEICFTEEYLALMKEISWGARKFAALLISHWEGDGFQTLLDYLGATEDETDKFSGIDGAPMGVREDVMDLWSYYGKPYDGLSAEWYGDVLRSKLITLRLPERLIKEYVKVVKKATTTNR